MVVAASPLYGRTLRLSDLNVLKSSPRNGGEDTVQAYYGWREARVMEAAKALAGAAVSLLVAWIVPFLKNEYAASPRWLVLVPPILLIAASALGAVWAFLRLNSVHGAFIRSMTWLQKLR